MDHNSTPSSRRSVGVTSCKHCANLSELENLGAVVHNASYRVDYAQTNILGAVGQRIGLLGFHWTSAMLGFLHYCPWKPQSGHLFRFDGLSAGHKLTAAGPARPPLPRFCTSPSPLPASLCLSLSLSELKATDHL